MDLHVHADEPALYLASNGSVMFSVWRAKPMTIPVLELVNKRSVPYAQTRPGKKIAVWTIITSRTPPPPEPIRRHLAATAQEILPSLVASPLTYDGSGFRAAIVRGVVTSMHALERAPLPEVVLDSHEKAADLICERLSSVGVAAQRDGLLEQFRAVMTRVS